MQDRDIAKILSEDVPVAAVLLMRGGWLSADIVTVAERFPADDNGPALWQIDLRSQDDASWHSVFALAETIIGISCRRTPNGTEQE